MSSLREAVLSCPKARSFPISIRNVATRIGWKLQEIDIKLLISSLKSPFRIASLKADKTLLQVGEDAWIRWTFQDPFLWPCYTVFNQIYRCDGTLYLSGENDSILSSAYWIHLSGGWFTKPGRYRANLRFVNSCGHQDEKEIIIEWVKDEQDAPSTSPGYPSNAIPHSAVSLLNTHSRRVHIWQYVSSQNNPNPSEEEIATLDPNEGHYTALEQGHYYSFRAVDPLLSGCSGNNPNQSNCIKSIRPTLDKVIVGDTSADVLYWQIS
jgi:hypothetical protein